ncbi:LysR family transcriptional regulator [Methylobacterium radiotolerans]|uniref:LysR family transcriptional regulator n=1 Tax=Methylobacterium radiotolerans TaxID=31998 RepID=UPI0009756517|nr:LysR family transcriptional regulator [Methylobacterium radiotolerans]MBY0253444.1 LysR family transcriptional regulator [Methylobacterium organophilum]ONF49059.1 LysR family transcriptional regulator [Methylobacterium radiotolerans]
MTLDQLRIFVAVAERQHVTRAAEALNIVQSAVSAAVSGLEGRHAVKLFHRVGRGIELTDAGRIFLGEARAVLARAEAAELVLSDLSGLRRGVLRVHASQTIASHWLPRHLVAFRAAYPEIAVRLAVGNTADVAQAVNQGASELGFVEGEIDDPALASTAVAQDRLVLVVPPNHPFAATDMLGPDDLIAHPWVLREEGSGTRSVFEAALAAHGVPPRDLTIALDLPSNESVLAAVEAGAGASVLSEVVVAGKLADGVLVAAPFSLPTRTFRMLRHKERYRSRAADALLDVIHKGQS